jgi:hypothetical protein
VSTLPEKTVEMGARTLALYATAMTSEDASVRLGDVLDFLREQTHQSAVWAPKQIADIIERVHREGRL